MREAAERTGAGGNGVGQNPPEQEEPTEYSKNELRK